MFELMIMWLPVLDLSVSVVIVEVVVMSICRMVFGTRGGCFAMVRMLFVLKYFM